MEMVSLSFFTLWVVFKSSDCWGSPFLVFYACIVPSDVYEYPTHPQPQTAPDNGLVVVSWSLLSFGGDLNFFQFQKMMRTSSRRSLIKTYQHWTLLSRPLLFVIYLEFQIILNHKLYFVCGLNKIIFILIVTFDSLRKLVLSIDWTDMTGGSFWRCDVGD